MNRFYPNVSERFEKRIFLNGFKIAVLKTFFNPSKVFKRFEIVFFLGPQETHLKEDIINQIKKPMFPEEELSNFPGLEVVMGATKYLSMAITNDSGTGQMLSTNLCPLLKICGPTSAVKFLNDQFENIHFISSVKFWW